MSESQLNTDTPRKRPTQIDKLNVGKCKLAILKEAGDRLSPLSGECSSLQRRGKLAIVFYRNTFAPGFLFSRGYPFSTL